MSYAFVLRTYPDIDHVVPLMWKLLESGEEVHAIVSPGYDPSGDHRLAFVAKYPRFHLHQVWPEDGDRRRGMARSTIPWAMGFLVRHDVRVVGVEWGYGLPEGYENLARPQGAKAVVRSFARSFLRARRPDPHQLRMNFIVAARLLGRATACLPHGLSIKLDPAPNHETMAKIAAGELDWRDRNRFSAYVLNTEHHRRFHVQHMRGDPQVMQTWGSLRWAPEWFEINRRLAPEFDWPADGDRRLKVCFMVPKWKNRVHADEVVRLVKALQELPFASVGIKGHPRPRSGSADPLRADPGIDWTHLLDVDGIDSVSLIRAADVVIDVGSSIGLEVLMQGKVLVNPAYVHEVRTLFDVIPGSCVRPESTEDLVAYLRAHAAGRPFQATEEAKREVLRRAVYGERDEPFDVIDIYYQRFRDLSRGVAVLAGDAR